MRWFAPLLLVPSLVLFLSPSPASAQTDACVALCRVPCVKPISIPDRWDDVTGIPGYMGGCTRCPDWRNNQRRDHESFNDADGDGLHDPGETYVDANGNESYDQEAYDPLTTGYVPAVDLGLELVLHVGSSSTPNPGQYLAVALPPVNRGTPELTPDAYRIAWSDCQPTPVEPGDMVQVRPDLVTGPTNQAMRDLIALDPDAYWDNGSVQGSAFPTSPRILFIPVYDPRIALTPSSNRLVVVKVVAFFMEQMTGPAQVRGRLLRVASSGETCGGAGAGGFIVECPVPAAQSSWGRIKSVYR